MAGVLRLHGMVRGMVMMNLFKNVEITDEEEELLNKIHEETPLDPESEGDSEASPAASSDDEESDKADEQPESK